MALRKSGAFLLAFLMVFMLTAAIFPAMPEIEVAAVDPDPLGFDVDEVFNHMTTKQKVGQLFWLRPETLDNDKTQWTAAKDSKMSQYPIGGICLFSANIVNPTQLNSLVNGYQTAAMRESGVPLVVSIDEEGGRVVRLANNSAFGLTAPPTMLSIGDTGNTQNAYNECARIGGYLKNYGINADFAPVTDVWSNPNNAVIGDRSFGKTADRVANMVEAAIQGFHSQGVMATSKHFPGHGDTGGDTHEGYVDLNKSWDTLKSCEIIPFQRAISAGVDMIMVAHIAVPEITGTAPSSLSEPMITGKLRGELGFNGVVVTDGMEMGAITTNYGAGPAAVAAIQAGCDVVLVPANFTEAWDAVMTAVNNSTISMDRLNESVLRILKLKAKYRNAAITWKNDDGTVIDTTTVAAGTVPTHADPTKPATAQYTYTFAGWSPDPYAALGNETYTATYTSAVNQYTVKWENYDGTVLETDTDVPYGTMPTYNGTTPTKPPDGQYTYKFVRWSPIISAVTGDVTYTAEFTADESTYKVTWYNYDGAVLETDEIVPYGTIPEYNSTTPTKPADEQYMYEFDGWTPLIVPVTGDAEYTAKFKKLPRKYTVTWKNDDGTALETDTDVLYGTVPEYNGTDPSKTASGGKRFVFCGWDKGIAPVNSDTTYTAQFEETGINTFVVLWMNDNGELIKSAVNLSSDDEIPKYEGQTPTKAPDAQYAYTFSGWSVAKKTIYTQQSMQTMSRAAKSGSLRPLAAGLDSDLVYTAQYTETLRTYTITWVNDNGAVLETVEDVPYGTVPEYNGTTPTKESSNYYTYTFAGWTPQISAVTGHSTYTATYTATRQNYTVTWKNDDGTELEKDEHVPAGNMPSYDGDTPTKASTAEASYIFKGWSPAVAPVTDNATYTAQFEEVSATEQGKIIVRGAVANAVYNAYRIFDFQRVDDTHGVYKLREGTWTDFVNQRDSANNFVIKDKYIDVDDNNVVTWHENADVRDFANLAIAWAKDTSHNVTNDGTATASGNPPTATISTTDGKLGYYLVDTNVGSICSLDTTNLNVAIYEKNPVPTLKKQVEEEAGSGDWRTENDAEIGEEVKFQSIITVPKRPVHSGENLPDKAGAAGYVYHDKMAQGLTFDSTTVKVWHKTGTGDYAVVEATETVGEQTKTNWALVTTGLTDNGTFRIDFEQTWLDTLEPEDKIKITYSAKVAEGAVIGNTGNKNEGKLDYGDGTKFDTGWQQTVTKVWKFSILKQNNISQPLPNAKFRILRANPDGTLMPDKGPLVFEPTNATDKTYRMSDDQSSDVTNPRVIDLITPNEGKIYLEGLDSGRYLIHEEEAPAGYSKMYGDVLIEIGSNGSVYYIDSDAWSNATDNQIPVLNQPGDPLPSTGKRGTRSLVFIGYVLVITATTQLVTKKMLSYME